MAEEPNEPVEDGDEVIDAPEDQQSPEVNDEQPDPLAELAKEMGWRPKEEFKGDPTLWKEPAEYIRAGADIQRTQSRELKEMRSTVDNIAKTNAAILADRLEAQRQELTARFNQAVEDGDSKQAFEVGQRLSGLENSVPQPNAPSPTVQAWAEKNSWFNADPLATSVALATAETYAKRGASTEDQLEAAEREVRRAYPHLFPQTQTKPPPGVNDPARNAGPARQGDTFADLPPAAKKVALGFEERGTCTKEAYAKQYWANQRSGQ